jgi:ATP-dependent DNA helicase PIF1
MPSHKLLLKIGAPVILLRNLDPLSGLCNGTRLIVRCFTMRVVEVEIITGKGAGNVAFIPRIKFISDNSGLPFTFARKQFPLRLAYAMTINKSQGQTLSHVGLHLGDDVFSHGQLYVAFSCTKAPVNIKVLLPDCAWPEWPYAQCCVQRSPPLRLHASHKWLREKHCSRRAVV